MHYNNTIITVKHLGSQSTHSFPGKEHIQFTIIQGLENPQNASTTKEINLHKNRSLDNLLIIREED